MAYDFGDVLEGVRHSRQFFYKHLEGMTEEQWEWKPFPECKSVRETLSHMIANDRAALDTLRSGKTPDNWEAHYRATEEEFAQTPREALLAAHRDSHEAILAYLEATYPAAETALDTPANLWGSSGKLAALVSHLSSEDFYHAGQVAFIRQATDASWNYYQDVYGGL
jgi:Uncharacterized protein conserved in bacteria